MPGPVWVVGDDFEVAVFCDTDAVTGQRSKFRAYTRYYNPTWEGCCLHHVVAVTGTAAKRRAIEDCKAGTGCGAQRRG